MMKPQTATATVSVAVLACIALTLVGCGGDRRIVRVSFQNVGSNPRGRHSVMTLHAGHTFRRVTALLPKQLPASSELHDGGPVCYEVVFTITRGGRKSVYQPCTHPRSLWPALRAMCRAYYGGYSVLAGQECSNLR